MSKQDEVFTDPQQEGWRHLRESIDVIWQTAFAAGREAERERVMAIIAELWKRSEETLEPGRPTFNMPIGVYINACEEITRRIKSEQPEEGKA